MTQLTVVVFSLLMARLGTFWFVAPIWGDRLAPRMVKVGLVLALSVFWFPAPEELPSQVVEQFSSDVGWGWFAIAVVREMLVGAFLGLATHVFFVPARIAGSYLAQELGLTLASQADPTSAESTNIVATLFQIIAILLFLVADLHHLLFRALDASFSRIPICSGWSDYPELLMVDGYTAVVEQGISIAGPVAVVLLVVLATLLLLARAVPTLNLFSVGLSLRLLAGFVALIIFLPQLLVAIQHSFASGERFFLSLFDSL